MAQQENRFVYSGREVHVFREEDMQCADCRHRTGDALECAVYERKSKAVMTGAQRCPDFEAGKPSA